MDKFQRGYLKMSKEIPLQRLFLIWIPKINMNPKKSVNYKTIHSIVHIK